MVRGKHLAVNPHSLAPLDDIPANWVGLAREKVLVIS